MPSLISSLPFRTPMVFISCLCIKLQCLRSLLQCPDVQVERTSTHDGQKNIVHFAAEWVTRLDAGVQTFLLAQGVSCGSLWKLLKVQWKCHVLCTVMKDRLTISLMTTSFFFEKSCTCHKVPNVFYVLARSLKKKCSLELPLVISWQVRISESDPGAIPPRHPLAGSSSSSQPTNKQRANSCSCCGSQRQNQSVGASPPIRSFVWRVRRKCCWLKLCFKCLQVFSVTLH